MMSKEYCRYIRTYSELEGLQHAHTLVYCGAAAAQGVVMELRQEQDGRVRRSAVLLQALNLLMTREEFQHRYGELR